MTKITSRATEVFTTVVPFAEVLLLQAVRKPGDLPAVSVDFEFSSHIDIGRGGAKCHLSLDPVTADELGHLLIHLAEECTKPWVSKVFVAGEIQ